MRKLLLVAVLVLAAGCTWDDVEKNSESVQSGSEKVQIVGTAVAPYTGGYGGLVATVAGAVGTVAGALAAFAKSKKAKQLAQAAVEAADATAGGGQAIVTAASANGVSAEVHAAYKAK